MKKLRDVSLKNLAPVSEVAQVKGNILLSNLLVGLFIFKSSSFTSDTCTVTLIIQLAKKKLEFFIFSVLLIIWEIFVSNFKVHPAKSFKALKRYMYHSCDRTQFIQLCIFFRFAIVYSPF